LWSCDHGAWPNVPPAPGPGCGCPGWTIVVCL
jgi:hypothetical protein